MVTVDTKVLTVGSDGLLLVDMLDVAGQPIDPATYQFRFEIYSNKEYLKLPDAKALSDENKQVISYDGTERKGNRLIDGKLYFMINRYLLDVGSVYFSQYEYHSDADFAEEKFYQACHGKLSLKVKSKGCNDPNEVSTLTLYAMSFKGDKGEQGDKGESFKYEDFTTEQLASLKGEKGDAYVPTEDDLQKIADKVDVSDKVSYSYVGDIADFNDYNEVGIYGIITNNNTLNRPTDGYHNWALEVLIKSNSWVVQRATRREGDDMVTYVREFDGTNSSDWVLASTVIESISVNGQVVKPDANKKVSITVPTKASDVGALPDTTIIPSVPEWAKAEEKPSYTAAEVGALPNIATAIITTQAEFESMLTSPTWGDVEAVVFIGDGGELEFTIDNPEGGDRTTRVGHEGMVIPANVKHIQGFNSAVIRVNNYWGSREGTSENKVHTAGVVMYNDDADIDYTYTFEDITVRGCTDPTLTSDSENNQYNGHLSYAIFYNLRNIKSCGYVFTDDYGSVANTIQFKSTFASRSFIWNGLGEQSVVLNSTTNSAEGRSSHAEGYSSRAEGSYSHAEGYSSHAEGRSSHAEGNSSHAEGSSSHAEGSSSHAEGSYSHAEGSYSHAEGYYSHAEGSSSHAEGYSSHAEGSSSHAEGYSSHAEGDSSHAEGYSSHAEGRSSHAEGSYSHAEGYSSHAYNDYMHVQGQFNAVNLDADGNAIKDNLVDVVGWGSSNTSRKNIETTDTSGNKWVAGKFYQGVNMDELCTLAQFNALLARVEALENI